MISLEEKLRPHDEPPASSLRDGLVWATLGAMFVAMLPVWWIDGTLTATLRAGHFTHFGDVIEHVSRRLLSYWLLPAMGFMFALRCGAIDLSVWTTLGLGGVVSAVAIKSGCGAVAAIAAGIGAGAACGIIIGALVAGLRVPCPIASVLVALGLIYGLPHACSGGRIVLNEGAMGGLLGGFQAVADWLGLPEVTLQSAAGLLTFFLYAAVMMTVLNAEIVQRHRQRVMSHRWRLFWALVASGALSAAGGVMWLIEYESAPVPGRLFDDMVIPASALLAGGLYLAGPGRTLLACVLLPGALAIVIGWRQEVMMLRSDYLIGYTLQVGVLAVMIGCARYAMTCAAATDRRRGGALALAWLSSLGIAVFAASVWGSEPHIRIALHVAGASIWLIGGLGAIALKLASPIRFHEA